MHIHAFISYSLATGFLKAKDLSKVSLPLSIVHFMIAHENNVSLILGSTLIEEPHASGDVTGSLSHCLFPELDE